MVSCPPLSTEIQSEDYLVRTPTVCREYLDNLLEYLYEQGVTPEQLHSVMRL
ncbi:MAG: hypothetical protein ACI89D_001950, partial [Bermanella sp.]